MVDERTHELIHAELDGELEAAGRAELEQVLAASAEARKLHDDLVAIEAALGRLREVEAPEGLRGSIIDAVRAAPARHSSVVTFKPRRSARERWTTGLALAAGVALGAVGLYVLQPQSGSGIAPSELAGTMVREQIDESTADRVRFDAPEVRGSAALFESDGVLVLQFDLDSSAPVAVDAQYAAAGLRVVGFAQGAVADANIHSAAGQVGYINEGSQRFVVYLARTGSEGGSLALALRAGGRVVQEASLAVPAQAGQR